MKKLMSRLLVLALAFCSNALAQGSTMDLNLAVPIPMPSITSVRVISSKTFSEVAHPVYVDGAWGRKIDAGDLQLVPLDGAGTARIIPELVQIFGDDLIITEAELTTSATELSLTWEGSHGLDEMKITVRAIVKKVALLLNQPTPWVDAVSFGIITQLQASMGL